MTGQKLRILGLHGQHGSAETLRRQAQALAAALADQAEIRYVDAPSLAEGGYGWWDGDGGGWSRTLDFLRDLWEREGPFDGVLGFSQGGALAGLLAGQSALDRREREPRPVSVGFAIVVGGYLAADPQHAPRYRALVDADAPSLHLIGRSDRIVSPAASRALAERFGGARIAEHDGGHVIPATPEVVEAVRAFLADRPPRPRGIAVPPAPILAPLWPDRDRPAMQVHRPTGATGARPALVVFRGGGYGTSSGSGAGAAEWAARQGLVGVEVEYGTRSTGDFFPANYADAARAVRLVRARASEWGIDPARVGVMGFSAGGHLATLLSTRPSLFQAPEDDLAPRFSARPDLVALGYPLISFVDGYGPGAYVGSVDNFFGRLSDEDERRRFSNELHVGPDHPPTFVWTTRDDALVPYTHSERFAEAVQRAGVPAELIVYPHGPHGMGLALDRPGPVREWTARLLAWLAAPGRFGAWDR